MNDSRSTASGLIGLISRSRISVRGTVFRKACPHLERLVGVAAVLGRVERTAVGEDQVDVLVGATVTGLDLDAAILQTRDRLVDVGRRLRRDDVDLLVGQRLHGRGRVTDDRVADLVDGRDRTPVVVRVPLQRQVRPLRVGGDLVRAAGQVQARVGRQLVGVEAGVPEVGDRLERGLVLVLERVDQRLVRGRRIGRCSGPSRRRRAPGSACRPRRCSTGLAVW